jgi:hypothetical protein
MNERAKVVEWVDIQAPCEEVFQIILDIKRRFQLSPLWGIAQVESIAPNYPEAGSSYRTKLTSGEKQDYQTTITEMVPLSKFAYCLQIDRETNVTWFVQEVASGTRLIYEEEFLTKSMDEEEFSATIRKIVRQWLKNIKNYAELRDGRIRRFIRWLLDRYYLNMRQDQRKAVAAILFLHAIGFVSFVMAAIAMGIASLVM